MKRFSLVIFLMIFCVCALPSGAEEIRLTTIIPTPPPTWEYNSSTGESYYSSGPTCAPHTKCTITLSQPGTWIISTSFEAMPYTDLLSTYGLVDAFLWAIKYTTHGGASGFLKGYVCDDTSHWIAGPYVNEFTETACPYPFYTGAYSKVHYHTFSGQAVYVATSTNVPITIELQFNEMNSLWVRNACLTAVKINNNET